MCCLFGMIDYKQNLSRKKQNKIISILSVACEERGTDATGIAYNIPEKLCIYKRPVAAHKLNIKLPCKATLVMGHTRMTTQGSEKKNFNNHPFYGKVSNTDFALAHNGVLYNDAFLRKQEHIPNTKIETDSYIAVQLIEQKNLLDFESLKYMAQSLEGSFTITLLDREDNLYFVKGDNPMCIYHFKDSGIYLYASTEEILKKAIKKIPYKLGKYEKVEIADGDILKIDKYGKQTFSKFDTSNLHMYSYVPYSFYDIDDSAYKRKTKRSSVFNDYIERLKYEAQCFGISENFVDSLLEDGYTIDDIEDFIYSSTY